MPHLLYSARDAAGKPVEGFVEADTVQQAREQLLARGCTDVVLHQDAAVSQDPKQLEGLTPTQAQQLARVKLAAMRRPGLAPVLAEIARTNRWWLVLDIGLVAWGVVTADPWTLAAGILLAAWPFAVAAWQFRHGGRYLQLLKAFAIGDWERVRLLAAKLRAVSPKSAQLDFDLDVRLAAIQARQGQIATALAGLERWRAPLANSKGLYETRVASIHSAAGNREAFVRLMGEAYELAGRDPARTTDYALAQARFGDAGIAQQLLSGLDATLLPPHAHGFVLWARGLVQLRLAQPGAADQLGRAVAEFLKLSPQPAAWTALAFCTCDHARALARAGRASEARRELAQVWPIVAAHADQPLLTQLATDGLAPT